MPKHAEHAAAVDQPVVALLDDLEERGLLEDKVQMHDLHATILHQLGIDHKRLTYRHAGRDYRLTDVHGSVVREILG